MGNLNYKNDLRDAFKLVRMMSNPILSKEVDIDSGSSRRKMRKLSVDLAGKIRDSMFSSMKKILDRDYKDLTIDKESVIRSVIPELDRLEDKLFKILYENMDFKGGDADLTSLEEDEGFEGE